MTRNVAFDGAPLDFASWPLRLPIYGFAVNV